MVLCTRRSMKGISMKSYDILTSFKSRTKLQKQIKLVVVILY